MKIGSIAAFTGTVGLACAGGALLPAVGGATLLAQVGGGMLGGIAANFATNLTIDTYARLATRYVEGFHGVDSNHHLALGLRRAQLKASAELLRNWRLANPQGLPESDDSFARTLARWCRTQESEAELQKWLAGQSADKSDARRLQEAFESALAADSHPSLETIAGEARHLLEASVLLELNAAGNAIGPGGFLARFFNSAGIDTAPPDKDPPAGFAGMFRGDDTPNSGWFAIFVRAIGTELRRPNGAFSTLWESAKLAGIDGLLTSVSAQMGMTAADVAQIRADVAKMAVAQRDVLAALHAQDAPRLYLPEGGESHELGFARFFYRTRWTEFVGRDDELAWLEARCLKQGPGLKLSLITAPGGHGKSRLALEHGWHMTLSQGWDAGFLDMGASVPWQRWQPSVPTLIILDYAAGRVDTIQQILRALATRHDIAVPIHLLLVERFGSMEEAFEHRSGARTWCHRVTEGDNVRLVKQCWAGQLVLASEDLRAVARRALEIMVQILAARGKELPSPISLLTQLHAIDPSLSPLFAMLVGDALLDGKSVAADSRYEFLISTLERSGIWRDAEGGKNPQTVRNLVALATLVRGIDLPTLKSTLIQLESSGFETSQFRPTAASEWGPLLDGCSRLTGRSGGNRIYGLEPDLLGEAMILAHCDPGDPDGLDRARNLHRVGWSIDTEGAYGYRSIVEMLLLMGRDFVERALASPLYNPPDVEDPRALWSYFAVPAGLSEVALQTTLRLYNDANARFDAATAPADLLDGRAAAAFNLCNGIREAEGPKAAMAFYESELQAPAMAANAPDGVRGARASAAANLCTDMAEEHFVDAMDFYEQELVAPAEAPDAPEEVCESRANAAFNLCLAMRQIQGLDAARTFYNEQIAARIAPAGRTLPGVAKALGALFSGRDAKPDRATAESLLIDEYPRLQQSWERPYPPLVILVELIEKWLASDEPFEWPDIRIDDETNWSKKPTGRMSND